LERQPRLGRGTSLVVRPGRSGHAEKPAKRADKARSAELTSCQRQRANVIDWLLGRLAFTRRRVVAYVITETCIGTKNTACVQVCPVDCIYDAGDHFIINPAECIDCSMCMPECPVEAIYPGDEVPEDMQYYVSRAAEFDYSDTAPGVELN
jgi:ferredoxin